FRQLNYNQIPGCWLHSIIFRTAEALPKLAELRDNNPLYQNIESLINEILNEEELNQELLAEWGEIWQGNQDPEDRENHKFYADQNLQQEILKEAERLIISELIGDGD
ncbi:MAG: DNA repair exonuclease, partial [Halanaerobium sp.]